MATKALSKTAADTNQANWSDARALVLAFRWNQADGSPTTLIEGLVSQALPLSLSTGDSANNLSDIYVLVFHTAQSLADVLSLSDVQDLRSGLEPAVGDGLILSDSLIREDGFSFTDEVSLSDDLGTGQGFSEIDSLSLSDILGLESGYELSQEDSLELLDSLLLDQGFDFNDFLSLDDFQNLSLGLALGEGMELSDLDVQRFEHLTLLEDNLEISDNLLTELGEGSGILPVEIGVFDGRPATEIASLFYENEKVEMLVADTFSKKYGHQPVMRDAVRRIKRLVLTYRIRG